MIRPFAQNIWDLSPPVSVELGRGQRGKAWAPPNTLGRILARVLHAETGRMARCSSAPPKTAKTKTFQPQRCGLISINVITRDSFEFEKRCQLFVRRNDEPLSVVAMRISNEDQKIFLANGQAARIWPCEPRPVPRFTGVLSHCPGIS